MLIKVMTYNICGGNTVVDRSGTMFRNPAACTEMIRNINPAFCGLNEVDYKLRRSNRIKLAQWIGESLGYAYAFAPAITMDEGTYGNGLVSRYPILETEIFPIADPTDKSEEAGYETRVILHAVIEVEKRLLDVFITHFGLAKSEQKQAVDTVLPLLKAAEHPIILMGDFNVTPDDAVLSPIYEVLQDTFTVYPLQKEYTYPSFDVPESKRVKIDYIFVSKEFKTVSVDIPDVMISDHKPYCAVLEL